jgi:uncharacterized coiled-coil DUF342 family protein
MDWIKSGLGQIIALVAIASTIAGFGYTGAQYIQRIELLEKKATKNYTPQIVQLEKDIVELKSNLKILENIPTIQKDVSSNKATIAGVKVEATGLSARIDALQKKIVENSKNPLSG